MKKLFLNKKGFTLLEVLVTTAVIGVLFTVSSAIFINTIRSANKANITNEAKENSSLVLEALERDVRATTGTSTIGSGINPIILNLANGTAVTWNCVGASGTNNGYVTRKVGAGSELPITNKDPQNGVNATCNFDVVGSSNILVTIHLSFTEGKGLSGPAQDISILVSHNASFSSRGH